MKQPMTQRPTHTILWHEMSLDLLSCLEIFLLSITMCVTGGCHWEKVHGEAPGQGSALCVCLFPLDDSWDGTWSHKKCRHCENERRFVKTWQTALIVWSCAFNMQDPWYLSLCLHLPAGASKGRKWQRHGLDIKVSCTCLHTFSSLHTYASKY